MAASDADIKAKKFRTIILGAGIAGLSAAKHFVKNSMLDFIILEAKSAIGGRISSVQKGTYALLYVDYQWYTLKQNIIILNSD